MISQLVLDALSDEPLMQAEARRGHGRNDYPVRPMWNSLTAGFVFQHPSIAAFRRELLRNGQLRGRCGVDPFAGAAAVPTEYAYTRFQRLLRKYQRQVEELFHSALEELQIELPDLGQVQALDGKELHSLAKGESSYPLPEDETQEDSDGRRDRDAAWGVKGSGKNKRWFGYLLHLVVVDPATSCRWRSRSPRRRAPNSRRRSYCLIRCRISILSCWNGAVA